MHHACAHHFYPAVAKFLRRVRSDQTHVDFDARFYERKVAWAKSRLDIRPLEQFSKETVERPLQVCKCYILTDRQSLYLKKFRLVRHVGGFVAEDLAGHDDSVRRLYSHFLLRLHVAQLDRRRMRTQYHVRLVFNEKSVLHIARGMVFGHIQSVEVVPFRLDQRTFGEGETHARKYLVRLTNERRYRMQVTSWHSASIASLSSLQNRAFLL